MAIDADAAGNTFAPSSARRVRMFDDVTAQLHEAIVSGQLAPGERLPNERELAEAFGVGRPTLREALRFLEALGLVEVRTGKKGGAFVTAPTPGTLGNALAALLALGEIPAADMTEFRMTFEVENARWAAQRADADDIASLEAIIDEAAALASDERRRESFADLDARWHSTLARLTKNALRICIAIGVHDAMIRNNRRVTHQMSGSQQEITDELRRSVASMAEITAAVAAGDAGRAEAGMRSHIERGIRYGSDVG